MYNQQEGYVQLFRNGIIEVVDSYLLEEFNGTRTIPSEFERELLGKLQMYTSAQETIGVEPPLFMMLSLLNISNYTMGVGPGYHGRVNYPIDRDVLVIPEIVVDSFDYDRAEVMRPAFDTVWNAAGWEGSINYNGEGKRVRNTRSNL